MTCSRCGGVISDGEVSCPDCWMRRVSPDRRFRRHLTRWLRRNTIAFAGWTAVMYLVLIPATLLLFPRTNLITACLVLLTGLTSSVASLGSLLVGLDE